MRCMTILLSFLAFISTANAANDEHCLARIIYAEARGESPQGALLVGQAAANRADRQDRSICRISGVQQRSVPSHLLHVYKAIARTAIERPRIAAKGADSWNRGYRPAYRGSVTRREGKHVFYRMIDD